MRRSGETYTRPSQAPSTPWAGLRPRAVDHLAREFSGLKISSTAELEDAIRLRLAKYVPAEAIDVEVEKVVRRIEAALGDADGTVEHGAPLAAHTSRSTNSGPEVLGPARPGEFDSLHPENAVKAEGQVPSPGLEPKPADAGGMTMDQPSIPVDLSIPDFLRRASQGQPPDA